MFICFFFPDIMREFDKIVFDKNITIEKESGCYGK